MSSEEKIIKIKNYISKMPSLPITVTKILEVCNNPKASPVDLNKIISLDPVLMARVLKLINSAYYGLSQQVTSLVRAIIMLGINTVKNLALSTAVLGTLGKAGSARSLNMDGFWRHSLCTGVTAKLIARKRKVDPKLLEEYFIAGLLHDIGKIPLNNRFPEEYITAMSIADREQIPLYKCEEDIIGINHADVGKLLVENWKLGPDILDTVASHHAVQDYEGKFTEMLTTIAVANYFAGATQTGFSGDRYPEKLPQAYLSALGIDWDFLDSIEGEVQSEIEKARIFLQVSR